MLVLASCSAIVAACTTAPDDTSRERVALIDPAQGAALLDQCSRPSPGRAQVDSYFEPETRDITALETAAMAVLRQPRGEYLDYATQHAQATTPFDWPEDPGLYVRQYVGYRIAGRRFVYGNFLPAGSGGPTADRPAVVCDGGPQFFGVEYDLDADRLVRIAFNGGLGGPFLQPIEP